MKCLINDKNEVTAFWDVDSNAPSDALTCDSIYPIVSYVDNAGNIDHFYTLAAGVVSATQAGIEYLAQQYARDRAAAYPSTVDQLDDIYHNGVTAWKATIKAVKDAHPKGAI
jgi:hypothetical protein